MTGLNPAPSRTIAWYTAKMFLTRTLAFLFIVILVLESLDILGESGKILAAPGNSEADLWVYVSLRIPQLIQLFLPFSVLLGTLVTLATLNQNSEVVIFKAAGISAHQILAPLIIAAFGIAVANFAFNERIVTRATQTLRHWQDANYYKTAGGRPVNTEGWVKGGHDLFHAETITGDGAATVLHDVSIYDRTGNVLNRVVMAAAARPQPGGWRLDGVKTFDVATGVVTARPTADFATNIVPRQFTTTKITPAFIPLWDLIPQIGEQKRAGKATDQLTAAAYHKVSGPLSAVLMPLLGAVAAFGLARSGRLFIRAVIGMFLGFAFFVADNFMIAMGNFGTVPPLVAAWAPFLLFLLIGEAVLLRTEE